MHNIIDDQNILQCTIAKRHSTYRETITHMKENNIIQHTYQLKYSRLRSYQTSPPYSGGETNYSELSDTRRVRQKCQPQKIKVPLNLRWTIASHVTSFFIFVSFTMDRVCNLLYYVSFKVVSIECRRPIMQYA